MNCALCGIEDGELDDGMCGWCACASWNRERSSLAPAPGYAAKRETEYKAAVERYYRSGTWKDHKACLVAFDLWLMASREERPHSAQALRTGAGGDAP